MCACAACVWAGVTAQVCTLCDMRYDIFHATSECTCTVSHTQRSNTGGQTATHLFVWRAHAPGVSLPVRHAVSCRHAGACLTPLPYHLADLFHKLDRCAAVDGEPSGWAHQLFYIRPRFGECVWDERRAAVLRAMLVSAVQRRFPPGLRVHVFSGSNVVLQDLVNAMKRHALTITR